MAVVRAPVAASRASATVADADLADPALNDSGVPWHELYFKENYSRLQAVKKQWDPRGEFSHALSVRPT